MTAAVENLEERLSAAEASIAALLGMIDTTRRVVSAEYIVVETGTSSPQVIEATAGGGLAAGDVKDDRLRLRPADAILPDANASAVKKVSGTDRLVLTLDFDQTTSESAYWYFVLGDKAAEAVRYHLCWSAAGGSAADVVKWDIVATGVADDEVFATGGSSDSVTVTDALIATGDLHVATVDAGAVTPFDANHLVFVELSRDTGVADNLAADAQFLGGLVEFRKV
jgi:hypothetical protein